METVGARMEVVLCTRPGEASDGEVTGVIGVWRQCGAYKRKFHRQLPLLRI